MNVVRFTVALVLAALIHFYGVRLVPGFAAMVDLFIVAVVLNALRGNSLAGLAGGVVAGLVQDALAGGPYGLYGFADTLVGYATARVSQRLILQKASAALLAVVVATLVQLGVLAALTHFLLPARPLSSPLWWVVKALAGGLVGYTLYSGQRAALGARERARRERVEKLRIDK